ncbi:MAG: hypothetical protein CVU09_03105 [Bacteroidetes bacterium HGW-Bacteroidetes-4]|jgi:hypothetical protein|nr:MAG: hypothetical protein CVU09_03105 [Bacteroidetes bacterium HGW-Bacteroidetes-4]
MIITDSIGAPRNIGTKTYFTETWPYLINKYFIEKINYSHFIFTQQALDSDLLIENLKIKLDLYDKEYIFIQCGIVDCARRVLSKRIQTILSLIPGINHIVKFIAKKFHYQLTHLYNVNYVSEKRYMKNLSTFCQNFPNSKIFLIPILPAGEQMRNKSYNISYQIHIYNQLLAKLEQELPNVNYLKDVYDSLLNNEDIFLSDGYHINGSGHLKIYNSILRFIQNDFEGIFHQI